MQTVHRTPDQHRDAGQAKADGQCLSATAVGHDDHGDRADDAGQQRDVDLALRQAVAQLPDPQAGGHGHEREKSLLADDQARQDQGAKAYAHEGGNREVAPCAAGSASRRLGPRRAVRYGRTVGSSYGGVLVCLRPRGARLP